MSVREQQSKEQAGRKAYKSPRLTRFGSVASLTQGGLGSNPDGGSGMGMGMTMSDAALKQRVRLVGRNCDGLGLYLYDYVDHADIQLPRGRQLGVMAQELQSLMPEAVARGERGYLQVNYGLLASRLDDDRRRFF